MFVPCPGWVVSSSSHVRQSCAHGHPGSRTDPAATAAARRTSPAPGRRLRGPSSRDAGGLAGDRPCAACSALRAGAQAQSRTAG